MHLSNNPRLVGNLFDSLWTFCNLALNHMYRHMKGGDGSNEEIGKGWGMKRMEGARKK